MIDINNDENLTEIQISKLIIFDKDNNKIEFVDVKESEVFINSPPILEKLADKVIVPKRKFFLDLSLQCEQINIEKE